MPALKRCHYETLGVERNATDDEIKKAFRKLALQQHPDKNAHRQDEAKEEFQVLQQAYEVLSNPQERAWYDNHRISLIRGDDDGEFAEDIIDIMPFCSSSCYKGFGDDDEGFYTVYRKLFERITHEEHEAGGPEDDSDEEIPNFGDGQSGYEDVVGPFYIWWEAYCTRQYFGWVDEYNTKHAGCRRVARLMDKENKKFRQEAKKLWNQKVRALVDFVKRKDKRYQAWKVEQERILKEKEEATKKKQAEEKAERLRERKKLFEQLKSSKQKNHLEENQDQLKQLESYLANEYADADVYVDDEEEVEEYLDEYCVPCQKSFRTKQALINHEKSKKHLIQLEKWAAENKITSDEEATEEEQEIDDVEVNKVIEENEDEIIIDKSEDIPAVFNGKRTKENGNNQNSNNESEEEDEDEISNISSRFVKNIKFKPESFENNISKSDSSKSNKGNKSSTSSKKKGKSKKQVQDLLDNSDESDSELNQAKLIAEAKSKISTKPQLDSDDEEFTSGRKKSAKDKKRRRAKPNPVTTTATNSESALPSPSAQNKGEITNENNTTNNLNTNDDDEKETIITTETPKVEENQKSSKKQTGQQTKSSSSEYNCVKCNENFDSRSKLFKHLEKTGHSVPIAQEEEKRGNKKGKGRRKEKFMD